MSSSDSDSEEEHSKCTKCGDDYPDNLFAYDNVCYQCVEEPNNNNNGNDDNNEIINKLGNDLNMRVRMGRNGSKRVAQLCSLKKFISSYEHLFINEIKKSKFHSVL